jgi:hypothetical protein
MAVTPGTDGTVFVGITTDAALASWPGERERSWSWRVISHLATDARMGVDGAGCPEVTFVMRPGGPSR